MKAVILAIFLAFSSVASAQTTRPSRLPVAAFFQPTRNLAKLAAMGVDTVWGPEVENAASMTPAAYDAAAQAWIAETIRLNLKVVLKRPVAPLPPNCVGVSVIYDEANAKNIPPSAVQAEADKLRAAFPGVRVFASYAGDKITSANLRKPAELALLQGYLAAADVVTVDVYSMNRNASRYLTSWTADAVKTVLAVRPDVECWAWVECNDQRLPPPALPSINRAPTPAEITDTVDKAVAAGAKGIGWFMTCDSGKYGWGDKGDGRGDSYIPLVDRDGVSMQPQMDAVAAISRRFNPAPTTIPTTQPAPQFDPALAALKSDLDATRADLATARGEIVTLKATVADQAAQFDRLRQALQQPATRPAQ